MDQWMEFMFRLPQGTEIEVDRLPEGTVEVSFRLPADGGRVTLVMTPELADKGVEQYAKVTETA